MDKDTLEQPINDIECYLLGIRDCKEGKPHQSGKGDDYDRGYNIQYQAEQMNKEVPPVISGSITEKLKQPFPADKLHWRAGATNKKSNGGVPSKAIALAYIDSRDVMKRLDDVCGDNWQVDYPFDGCCRIGIKIGGGWVWRANGAGETDVEGEKGKYSDAFKRAAVLWGIGRYLYYLPNQWVDCDQYGSLRATPALPEWAIPKE